MQIKPNQLSQHLQKNIGLLYTVFGNEPLLINEATDLIRAVANQQGYTERDIFTVDKRFNWSMLQDANRSGSLFGDRKIIDIRIPNGKPGREGSQAIEKYCQTLTSGTLTLITLPKIDKSGQATKWFKMLEATGITVVVYPVERGQLPAWIKQRLSQQQQQTDFDTLRFLADRVEGNLLAAHQEIQKLALLYPTGRLLFKQVKDAVLDVARYDVFNLADAMIAADIARYSHILDELRGEGVVPPLIVATLAEQIRTLLLIQQGIRAANKSLTQLMRDARVWGARQKIMADAAKHFKLNQLTQALLHLAKIDRISKGVANGDVWDELLQLGLRFVTITHKIKGRSNNTLPIYSVFRCSYGYIE